MHVCSMSFILLCFLVWQVTVGEAAESFANLTDVTNCTLIPRKTQITGELRELIDNENRKITINVEITGELGPLGEQYPGGLFEPKKWILITEEAGRSLLLFPDDQVAMSLYTLSFGVSSLAVTLDQQPENCLNRNYSLDQILNTIRFYVLRNFTEDGSDVPDNFEVCNRQVIFKDDNKSAELKYICCNDEMESCYTLEPGRWMNTLDICLFILEFVLPFLCPLLIPKQIFKTLSTFSYIPDRCHGRPPKLLVCKISSNPNPQRYTQIEISLPQFETFMSTKLQGIHSLEVKSIQLEAREEKLIEEGSHPFGFWNFLLKTFVECEMRKGDDNLNDCCNQNICKPFTCCYMSWIQFLKCIMYLFLFAIFVSPWLFRVFFFYKYDYQLSRAVESVGNDLNVEISSPSGESGEFLFDYIIIGFAFLFFIFYSLATDAFRSSIKTLLYACIHGKNDVSQLVSSFVTNSLFPFKKCGLICGCFLFGFWIVLVVPFLFLLLVLQTLPLLNVLNNFFFLFRELQKADRILKWRFAFTSFLCLEVIFLFILIVNGCVIFYINCFAYAMIGLLLNYDDVFKYVCLISLFLVYGYNCFNNIHKRYSYFSKLLSRKLQGKIVNQFNLDDQEEENDPINTAHIVSSFSYQQPNEICFTYLHRDWLYWRARRLVYFLDRSEAIPTPYISKQFFGEMNSIKNSVCPGSQYILYLKACRDFIIVVIFLLFVLIVIFALGRAHDLSSGVQTIVAIVGGFLPFVFEKFFSKSHIRNMSEIENSLWEKILENRIDIFEELWKVRDIEVQATSDTRTVCRSTGSIQGEVSDTQEFDFVVSEETTLAGKISKLFVPNTTLSIDKETEMIIQSRATYESLP
ncbi:uncharacterized protein LOC128547102 [Mercenaria mercenaria]|uniref:uncharacterized protein LOC128547102 n=1 Tax=Mercenaria mercenaria TaxID=6596 RepID=UPI00234F1F63|nr:uncharacterized protein LOC128547102 [Mercenaria mercenaria]